MTLDMLDGLEDAELRAIISRCNELLTQHDRERKHKALENARAILAEAGLNLKDVTAGKPHKDGGKAPVYRGGQLYRHPSNEAWVWNARGQKPHWLRELEAEGRKPIELPSEPANDNVAPSLKKAG